MSMFPPFLAFMGMLIFAAITVTSSFLGGSNNVVDSRIENTRRLSDFAGTSISLSVASVDGATVTVDVANTGRVPLGDWQDWDVWANFHDATSTHYAEHLTYTSASSPGAGQWSLDGIYLNAVAGDPEAFQPNILDPGETARIVFRTTPNADGIATNTLAVSTPNGVHLSTAWRDWIAMATAPADVNAGGALATDGSSIFALRGGTTADFWSYDTSGNAWTTKTSPTPTADGGAALAYAEQGGTPYVYAIFGGGSTSFYRYDIGGDTWQSRSTTPFPMQWGGGLAWDGGTYIYAIGGQPTLGSPVAFWRYDVDTNLWSILTDVPESVGQGGAIAYTNGKLYVIPGGGSTSFYAYNVSGSSWSTLANTPSAVAAGGSLQAVGNNLYALAGNGTSFWRYQTATDSWTAMTPTLGAVGAGGSLTYAGSHFYAIRGGATTDFWRY